MFCSFFLRAWHVIKEPSVLILCLILDYSSRVLLETPIRKSFSVTERRTHLSIRRGRNKAPHEFPLISVPRELLSRRFHRSPITLHKVDLVPSLTFPWRLLWWFFAVSRYASRKSRPCDQRSGCESRSHVRDDAWRWKISSWCNLKKYGERTSVILLEEYASNVFTIALIDS